jgi:hypothetical protein
MHFTPLNTKNANVIRNRYHNFEVESQRIKTERNILIPDKKAMIRTDTNGYLGTVGKNWEPVQPEVLYDMAKELIKATDGKINGVVNLFDGAIIGISFKLAEREYIENDFLDLNFFMLTAFNGMYGLSGSSSSYRHSSRSYANTSNKAFNLKHTKFVGNRIEVVKDMLKYYNQEITSFDLTMNRLVTRPMSEDIAVEWFETLYPRSSRHTKPFREAVDIFKRLLRNEYLEGVKGTSYGAWAALTHYVNHYKTVKVHNGRDPEEVRFQSINFGTGNNLIQSGITKLTNFHFEEDEFIID